MTTFQFKTGRTYNGEQVLHITAPIMTEQEDGLIDWVPVSFRDESRDIKGIVTLMVCEVMSSNYDIGKSVVREYDAGRYQQA